MKKLVASLAAVFLIVGTAATTVSAETYEIEKGDTLWNIAKKYNMTVEELLNINGLHTTLIHPKQTLVISEEKGQADTVYVVEQGDTLSGIAGDFSVSVKDIKTWNDLSSDLIVAGQELAMNGTQNEQQATAEDVQTTETQTKEAPAEKVKEETVKEEKTEETKAEAPAEKPAASEQSNTNESPQGKTISVSATAYTAKCEGCTGVTATGVDLNADPDAKVIAVDPNVIPLGSKVYVEGYGYATAADTGGAIKGNKIDLHVPNKDEAYNWGVQSVNVTIVE